MRTLPASQSSLPTGGAGLSASRFARLGMLVALLALSAPGSTEQATASLGVSARVVPVARLDSMPRQADLLVTAADLARGYVDAAEAVNVVVFSNSQAGFAIDVVPLVPAFTGIDVQGFDGEVRLPGDGGTVTQRWDRAQRKSLELRFRFMLARDAAPGRYPWPVRLDARPLPPQ